MSQSVRTAAQAAKDAVVFKALANAVRLQIVSFVAASPEGQVSAGEIVDRFDLSQPTISHHLRVLREARVLTAYKSSTFVYYRFDSGLQETVSSVLPRRAAAQPPVPAGKPKRKPYSAGPDTATQAKPLRPSDPSAAAERGAAPRGEEGAAARRGTAGKSAVRQGSTGRPGGGSKDGKPKSKKVKKSKDKKSKKEKK